MTQQNKTYLIGIVGIVVIGGLLYWNSQQEPADVSEIRIGAALALTGGAAPWGEASLKAAELAVDEINAAGGINGKKLSLKVEDSKSTSKDSVSAISKLMNVDSANALMITWLDSYLGAESIVPTNTLLISQDAAVESVNVPTNHSNVFSLWYRTESKSNVTLDAIKKSGATTVYIVTQSDSYYETLRTFLRDEAAREGIEIIGEEVVQPGSDVRTVVTKIANAKPDAVFFGSYDSGINLDFLKRYKELVGASIPLYGDEFIEQNITDGNIDPSLVEGAKFYFPTEPNQEFRTKYRAKYNEEPKYSAGTTYDTVYVIAKYLQDNPGDVSEYMRKTEFLTITYGNITFDEIGGVVSEEEAISMKQVVNGKIVSLPK